MTRMYRQPLEIDVAREVREIMSLAPRNHLAACSPEFIRDTAFLLAKARQFLADWLSGHHEAAP